MLEKGEIKRKLNKPEVVLLTEKVLDNAQHIIDEEGKAQYVKS